MTRLPRLRGKELTAALKRAGFEVVRVRGSHHFLRHADGRTTVVPVHAGDLVGPGLVRKILRDCDLTADEIESLR
jgi:predicted RNA binding protein YcfA (HicA-like mRNA interferase family)